MTAQSELQQAHTDLLACYEEIRGEFADVDNQTLARFLGKYNSRQLRQQVREHGDGYTIRSVPRRVEEILSVDDTVLIVVNSPKLDQDSVFDPHTNLVDISYWRDGKSLQDEVDMPDGSLRKLLFLVWEQDCPVHGKNDRWGRSDRDAGEMESLLCKRLPGLEILISEAEGKVSAIAADMHGVAGKAQSETDSCDESEEETRFSNPTVAKVPGCLALAH